MFSVSCAPPRVPVCAVGFCLLGVLTGVGHLVGTKERRPHWQKYLRVLLLANVPPTGGSWGGARMHSFMFCLPTCEVGSDPWR
jgi:hypothetical protein